MNKFNPIYPLLNPFMYLFILHSTIWYNLFPNKWFLYSGGYLLGYSFLLFDYELKNKWLRSENETVNKRR